MMCQVSFVQLLGSPFNLRFLDTVQVKFNAVNAIGESEYSEDNVVGSFIETKPSQVKGVMIDPLLSTTTSILIKWTHLYLTVETGASPILNYKIRTD